MKKKQFRSRLRLLILLALLLIGGITYAAGKYVKTMPHSGTVTFTARLAEKVELWEHEAVRQNNGSYSLDGSKTVRQNSYVLIPGLDIAKDPYVQITGKTDVPAHLYVEIVTDTIDRYDGQPVVTYAPGGDWKLSERASQHGGTVYVYTGGSDSALTLTSANTPAGPIYILADKQIRVSQHAKYADNTTNGDTDMMKIYAYLVEAANN